MYSIPCLQLPLMIKRYASTKTSHILSSVRKNPQLEKKAGKIPPLDPALPQKYSGENDDPPGFIKLSWK